MLPSGEQRVETLAEGPFRHLFRQATPTYPANHGKLRQYHHHNYQRELSYDTNVLYEQCKAPALPKAKRCRSPLLETNPNTAQIGAGIHNP